MPPSNTVLHAPRPHARAGFLFSLIATLLLLLGAQAACNRTEAGSPEAVADAFADAYFRRADQQAAKAYTAFGASSMLDRELADVKRVREQGYSPTDAQLSVSYQRGDRSKRNERVRFSYTLKYQSGALTKYADIELSLVQGSWKVVRVAVANHPPIPASS